MELKMDQPLNSVPALLARNGPHRMGARQSCARSIAGSGKRSPGLSFMPECKISGRLCLRLTSHRGDVVAILSETRPEAVYADLAILGCGAASVAIDPDDDPDRVAHQLSSSGSRLVFVENEEQLDKILSIRELCPALSRIVVFDMKGLRDFADANCVGLAEFAETGGRPTGPLRFGRSKPVNRRLFSFLAATGNGLGRSLTHGDLMHMIGAARARLPIRPSDERLAVLALVGYHRAGLGSIPGAGDTLHQQLP